MNKTGFEMEKIDKKLKIKIGVGAFVLLIIFLLFIFSGKDDGGVSFSGQNLGTAGQSLDTVGQDGASVSAIDSGDSPVDIIIHVAGAVYDPKIVVLKEGSRVYEAIAKAGGLSEQSDSQYLNLAATLKDGDKLYIPSIGEFSNKDNLADENAAINGNAQTIKNMKSSGYISKPEDAIGVTSGETNGEGLVNINTADSQQLQTLTGVGPSTAEKIITYRNTSGSFTKIEDLKNVSGIGEKTFQKFMDKICV